MTGRHSEVLGHLLKAEQAGKCLAVGHRYLASLTRALVIVPPISRYRELSADVRSSRYCPSSAVPCHLLPPANVYRHVRTANLFLEPGPVPRDSPFQAQSFSRPEKGAPIVLAPPPADDHIPAIDPC